MPEDTHAARLAEENYRYLIIETAPDAPAGFVILAGYAAPVRVIELMRIMIDEPGRGSGRRAMNLTMAKVFNEDRAERLWLDVYTHNPRAHHLYQSLGFQEERRAAGLAGTLIIMAIDKQAYRALRQ